MPYADLADAPFVASETARLLVRHEDLAHLLPAPVPHLQHVVGGGVDLGRGPVRPRPSTQAGRRGQGQ